MRYLSLGLRVLGAVLVMLAMTGILFNLRYDRPLTAAVFVLFLLPGIAMLHVPVRNE